MLCGKKHRKQVGMGTMMESESIIVAIIVVHCCVDVIGE